LPSFVFVAATGPLIERWRTRPVLRGALDLVNAIVVGLIAAVAVRLAPAAVGTTFALVVAAAAGVALWMFGFSTTAILGAAALAGLARRWLPGGRRDRPSLALARPQPEPGQRPGRQIAPRGRVGVAAGMGGVDHLLPRAEPRQREGAVRRARVQHEQQGLARHRSTPIVDLIARLTVDQQAEDVPVRPAPVLG